MDIETEYRDTVREKRMKWLVGILAIVQIILIIVFFILTKPDPETSMATF